MLIPRSQPYSFQPPLLPQLDGSSEFSGRLVGGFSVADNALLSVAWKPIDLVRSVPQPTGTVSYGAVFPLNGTSHKINIPGVNLSSTGPAKSPGVTITSILFGGSQNGRMLFEQSLTADTNDGFYIYGITSSGLRFGLNTASASFISKDITYTLPTVPTVVQFIIDSSVNPTVISILENGVVKATDTIATAGYFANDTIYIGSRAGTSLFANQKFGDTLIHAGPLTLTEAARFAANMWQVFADPDRIIILPDAGVSMPVLSAPSFAGRVPRVTITH